MKKVLMLVLLAGMVSSVSASVTEHQLRSAQNRLGMSSGQYNVSILPESVPNAGARRGGYIRITSGMMAFAADEDEIAGVLAHEKGHVDENHFRSFDEAAGVYYGSEAASKAAGAKGGTADVISGGLTLAFLQRRMFRGEYRADEYAKKQLAAAGYRPDALETLFARLKGHRFSRGSGDNTFCFIGFAGFKTHPSFDARISALRGGRQLEQRPLQPATTVGPILVVVENRLRGYSNGFFIWSPRRIFPSYDDPTAKVTPAAIEALINRGFDVIESENVIAYLDGGYRGRYDEAGLLEIAEKVRASHVLIVALVDDNINSTGNVQISTGRFGRRDIELEAAQRKIRLTARLVQANRLVVWSSSRSGNEGAFVASYRDFGFFNGVGAQVGKTNSGAAVKRAANKIAEQLRKDVAPAPAEPKSAQAGEGTMPDPITEEILTKPEPKYVAVPKGRYYDFEKGVKVLQGQMWEYFRERSDGAKLYGGTIRIKSVEELPDGKIRAYYDWFDGEYPPSLTTPLRLVR